MLRMEPLSLVGLTRDKVARRTFTSVFAISILTQLRPSQTSVRAEHRFEVVYPSLTCIAIFALNWAVSQATSLINTNFILAPDSHHIGIEMDGGEGGGGSGTAMADVS